MLELILFIVLGVVVYLLLAFRDKKGKQEQEPTPVESALLADESTVSHPQTSKEEDGECCGQHLVCERDSLLNKNANIEYYDDEELDILSGIAPSQYTPEQIQMLQDIFYTLRESDVAGWVRSLQMRNIELTPELRDEALMIVRERRSL